MIYKYDVQNKRDVKKLYHSKRFPKYPDMFLSNTCQIRVNPDELLKQDEFVICSKSKILPKKIYLYGKKTNHQEENNIYLNYWTDIFLKTVEKGSLYKYDFNKSDSKLEMCIGLPLKYRGAAFRYKTWTRENIIMFLNCLFDVEIEETNYEQQDLFENLMAA